MLGLSCTFLACVFDRPGWKLYIFETMSWAFGGPMLGHLMALLSLCSVYFEEKNATIWVYFQLI